MDESPARYTAFVGQRLLARGPAAEVAVALKRAYERGEARVTVFEDESGRPTDFDLRGDETEVAARYGKEPARRGRPKLGVVAREVTLLPRHWDWLARQPGGASPALRRLVQEAMADPEGLRRERREAAYRVMSALAGDLANFEEASRALFADDRRQLEALAGAWPADVRVYLRELLGDEAPQA